MTRWAGIPRTRRPWCRRRATVSTGLILLALSPSSTALAAAGDVELLSPAADLAVTGGGISSASGRSISANGRYVVFVSDAANLVHDQVDTNKANDVFLRDRLTGTTVLVSHTAGSLTTAGNRASSGGAVISADGRYVAFVTAATNLGFTDSGTQPDVVLFDRIDGSLRLVSHADGNLTVSPNSFTSKPRISTDGRYVAFFRQARDAEILLFDRDGALGSRRKVGGNAIGHFEPSFSMSADGRYVAFTSTTDYIENYADANSTHDVFLFDRDADPAAVPRLVSHPDTCSTSTGNAASFEPVISADGRWVVFASLATDLGFSDANGDRDLFLFDRDGGAGCPVASSTRLLSHSGSSLTTTGDQPAFGAAISSDGRYVAFESNATDMGFIDSNLANTDVFLFDRLGPRRLVSHAAGSPTATGVGLSAGPAISDDGRYVAFSSVAYDLGFTDVNTGSDVFLFDRDDASGALRLASHQAGSATTTGNTGSSALSISGSGPVVVFASDAYTLVGGDLNALPDVFVFDAASAGDADLVSRRAAGLPSLTPGGNSPTALADGWAPGTVSDDGRYVVFLSSASNLVPNQFDLNGANDVFLRDRLTGTTTLVSHQSGSTEITGDSSSAQPTISGDGRFVAYLSAATNLAGTDANDALDVFLFDRALGSNVLVSHDAGSLTTSGNAGCAAPEISRDGRYVVFTGFATDHGFIDVNGADGDVLLFQRGGPLGSRRLVSHNGVSLTTTANGWSGALVSSPPAISRDGRHVAFQSFATDLGFLDANGGWDVFLFDRDGGLGSTRLVSHTAASLTTASSGGGREPVISDDGRYVAYETDATDHGFTDANGRTDVLLFERDGGLGSRRLVSHEAGSLDTAATHHGAGSAALSSDGRYTAFTTTSFGTTTVWLFDSESAGGSSPVSSIAHRPSISADGRWVSFESDQNNLSQAYLFDRDTATVSLVSHRIGPPATTGNDRSFGTHVSANGEVVVFSSSASDLIAGDFNRFTDLFAYSNEQPPWSFFTVPPCRVFDTRSADPPALAGEAKRLVTVEGVLCGVPATARAVTVNVTASGATAAGYVVLYPADLGTPLTSTVNFAAGQTRANNAVVRLAVDGTLAAKAFVGGGSVHLIVDVTGYFE